MQFHNTVKQTSEENKKIHEQVDIVKQIISPGKIKILPSQGIPSWLANFSPLCFLRPLYI